MARFLPLGQVADKISRETGHAVKQWQVRRLFERGILPPAERIASYRVIAEGDLPKIIEALRTAGYLPEREVAA